MSASAVRVDSTAHSYTYENADLESNIPIPVPNPTSAADSKGRHSKLPTTEGEAILKEKLASSTGKGKGEGEGNTVIATAILATEEDLNEKTSSVGWIWELSKPERPYLVLGITGCVFVGAAFPLLGYFLGQMISVFFNPSVEDMRNKAAFW